jgi:Uma2 family endonuclease
MPDDGFRYELVRGELRQMTPAGQKHGRITVNLTTALAQYVRAKHLGIVCAAETGFKLGTDPDFVRAPDAAFICQERAEQVGDIEGYWPGAPDLAVEVISPNDLYADVEEKVFDWLTAGTRMVLVINPRKRIVTAYHSLSDVIILKEADVIDGRDVVPGWKMPVSDLFAL